MTLEIDTATETIETVTEAAQRDDFVWGGWQADPQHTAYPVRFGDGRVVQAEDL
jgi:hypothetical protein